MTTGYQEFPLTESFKNSHPKLLANDKAALSLNAGTAFPTNPLEGMYCYRTDTKVLNQYIDGKWAPAYSSPVSVAASAGDLYASADDIDRTGFYSISGSGMNAANNTSTLLHIERYWSAGTKKFQMNFLSNGQIYTRVGTVDSTDSSKINWTNWRVLARSEAGDSVSFGSLSATSASVTGNIISTGAFRHTDTTNSRTDNVILFDAYDGNGGATWINGTGGLTAIGGGESAVNLRNNLSTYNFNYGSERLFLTSDNEVRFITQANTWANRVDHILSNQGFDTCEPDLVKGTTPTVNTYTHLFLNEGGGSIEKNRLAGIEAYALTNGRTGVAIRAYEPTASSTSSIALVFERLSDGTQNAYLSQTPVDTSNDTKIATTKFVNTRVENAINSVINSIK